MDRGRKREAAGEPPADKRACSSSDYRPCSAASSSPPQQAPPPPVESEMESSSSSGRSDRGGDSGYGSCDSDDFAGGYDSRCTVRQGRLQRVIAGLVDDSSGGSAQLAALTDLCEVLSFCMEDAMGYFPVETVVPPLVKLAGHESNPDVMLLAIRAITYLCDAMPRSAEAISRHGALPVLCGRLLAIEYLDVAEQCHQALEKISRKQPVACLQAGIINAVLTYIDFFSTSSQRVAVSTVANICKKLPPDCSSIIMASVPTLCNLLHYEDRKLVETVAACLVQITDYHSSSMELLDELCKHGIIQKSLQLIDNEGHRQLSLSRATYSGLIGLLTKLASNSLLAVETLFGLGISRTMSGILMGSFMPLESAYAPVEDVQANQVYEVLRLANQLIPPAAVEMSDNQLMQAKEKILVDHPNFLYQLAMEILPASVQVVKYGANTLACYGCISIIKRIAYFGTSDMLLDSTKGTNISSLLAGLLARKDLHVLISTLETIEILMQKLPGVFLSSFVKEGVAHAIDALLMQEKCTEPMLEQSDDQMSVRDISKCLCYAFASSRTTSESKTCKLEKDTIYNLGRHIKSAYFNYGAVNSEMGFSETLHNFKTLCRILNESVNSYLIDNGGFPRADNLTQILNQIMKELYREESMSTFEFVESDIMRSLAHYLSNGKYLLQASHATDLACDILAVLKRLQIFASIGISDSRQSRDHTPFAVLLKKLLSALSSLDNFPVILSHGFKLRNTYLDIPARSSTINPCLRVRFVREKDESNLSDHEKVVNVDISSSFDAMEGYLWPKVSGNTTGHSTEFLDTKLATTGLNHATEKNPSDTHANISLESCISISPEVIRSQQEKILSADATRKQTICGKEAAQVRTNSASPSAATSKPKLTFSLRGKQLGSSMTLYQAIIEDKISSNFDMVVGPKFWSEVYKLTYKRAEEQREEQKANTGPMFDCVSQSEVLSNMLGFSWQKLPFFSCVLVGEIPCKIDKVNPSYDILFMLKILEGLNRYSLELLIDERVNAFGEGRIDNLDDLKVTVSSLPEMEFVSTKLTDKLEQQMRDPLVLSTGVLPLWCCQLMAVCPFLFSFEARWKYFYLTTFGSSRNQQTNIQNLDSISANFISERRLYIGSSSRKKFKVDRNNIIECAEKMMELHAQSKGPLEVEYVEEVGTGLGPTMEFYTLVSREFQKLELGMWREEHRDDGRCSNTGESGSVLAPFGLFPRPWSKKTGALGGVEFSEVTKKFILLGKLVAKAIKDGRILDIPFSRAFYKMVLEQELSICDIQSFAPELGKTLLEFQALVNRKKYMESVSGQNNVASKLHYRNTNLKDLCLDFTLPGYSDYELSSEVTKVVSIANLEEYVDLVVDATIRSGILRQLDAFKSGFNEVFPLKALQMFTEDELERLLCGEQDSWDFAELVDHIKFDHGYTADSPTVISLLEIIQEFERDQRRAFLQFVTGSPRLPPGGLAALNPKLTVVRKHCSCDADLDLPSVMTCANYLKLPPYSSKEKMKHKLLYAITEGQGSFHLS